MREKKEEDRGKVKEIREQKERDTERDKDRARERERYEILYFKTFALVFTRKAGMQRSRQAGRYHLDCYCCCELKHGWLI